MKNNGAAGQRPGAKRPAPSTTHRSRAAAPTRRPPTAEVEQVGRQTALTARAAILIVALASVAIAIAVPLKVWMGQRSDIANLSAQTKKTQARLQALAAEHKRWNDPSYVETQARQRLHFVLPGEKTYIVLGKGQGGKSGTAEQRTVTPNGPWYQQFWQSDQAAGDPPATTK